MAADTISCLPQLSCLAPSDLPPLLDSQALSTVQAACPAMVALAADWHIHVKRRLHAYGHVLLCSTLTVMDCPLLPPEFHHHPAFDALSHPGVRGQA